MAEGEVEVAGRFPEGGEERCLREKLQAALLQMLRVAKRRAQGAPRGGGADRKGRVRREQQVAGGGEGKPCRGWRFGFGSKGDLAQKARQTHQKNKSDMGDGRDDGLVDEQPRARASCWRRASVGDCERQ